jgi:acyl-CoA thioesterase I
MTSPRNGSLRQFVLLIAAIVLIAACFSRTKEQALPAGSQVLALGDSLTEGAGVTPERAWPDLLARKTGWVVVNGGVRRGANLFIIGGLTPLIPFNCTTK